MTKKMTKRSKQGTDKNTSEDARNDQQSVILRGNEIELGGEPEEVEEEVVLEEDGAEEVETEEVKGAEEIRENAEEEAGSAGDGTQKRLPEVEKPGFWHRVNVSYPWLKFALAVLAMVAVLAGGFGVASLVEGSHEVANVPKVTEPVEPVEPEAPAEGKDKEITEAPTEEKPEEKPDQTEEQPGGETDGGVSSQPPSVPVTVPEGAQGKKLIALTFDDGPSTATTGRLLDILREKKVRATFFVLGNMAQRAPALVQREEAEGHEVGSHTPWHNQQTKLSAANIQAEEATMNQIFTEILGHTPVFTRPPYGAVNEVVRANLAQPLILWSIDPEDWKYRNTATVRANVVRAAHDGAIALMHDIHATTVEAVPGIIDDLRAQGYEFLTVSELAKARGVGLANGWTYYNFRP